MGRLGSYCARMSSASDCFLTFDSSILRMPWTYLAKSLLRAASTGALSTEMRFEIETCDRRATTMAVLAPLVVNIVRAFVFQGAIGCLGEDGGVYAHGMSDQGAVLDAMLLQKVLDILGKRSIVVARVVRRLAMIP